MLKSLIFLVILSVVLASDKTPRERLLDADDRCQKEHHVQPKAMDDLYKELPNGTDHIERKYKFYTKCVLDELNYKDEHGNVDFKQIAEVYYPVNMDAQKVTHDCVEKYESEADKCEKYFKILACMALTMKTGRNDSDEESD